MIVPWHLQRIEEKLLPNCHMNSQSFEYMLPAAWSESIASLSPAKLVFAGERQDRVMGDLESQFITGLKRKDGRTVGLGL